MNIIRGIFIACLILTSFTLLWHFKVLADSAEYYSDKTVTYNINQEGVLIILGTPSLCYIAGRKTNVSE